MNFIFFIVNRDKDTLQYPIEPNTITKPYGRLNESIWKVESINKLINTIDK